MYSSCKCSNDLLTDYPVCAECAKTAHFPHRAVCLCNACTEAPVAEIVRVFADEPPLMADLLSERRAA